MKMILKLLYRRYKKIISKLKFYYSINWTKTLFFNFSMLPYYSAKKIPILFYGKVKFTGLTGKVIIDSPIKFGMVGFGQKYEMFSVSKRNAQLTLNGTFIIKGHVQFGIDFFVYISKGATLEMGHLSSLGGSGKIICTNYIKLDDFARVGFESQIIDSNFHLMKDLDTGNVFPISNRIHLGKYNYVGNRVSIMQGTKTPDYCTIASSSLCNKYYSNLGENILIGGMPAKLIRNQIVRCWDEEIESLKSTLII
jgi:acetyltransferase-like isoleucine patch superfamily enzyme